MLEKLENFMNEMADKDWYWWPFVFLRPQMDQEMDDRLLLKLTLMGGSLVGLVFMLVMFLAAIEPLGFIDGLLIAIFSLLFGWILFFVYSKLTYACFWNRRARRLRFQQSGGLRVHIYMLRREADDWVIDEKHPVAVVTVTGGQGSFHFYDKSREKMLRELFTNPARAHRGGGKTPGGVFVDAYVTHPAWTREALELLVNEVLRGYYLGGRIVESGPSRSGVDR